jgi:hypothetical protein
MLHSGPGYNFNQFSSVYLVLKTKLSQHSLIAALMLTAIHSPICVAHGGGGGHGGGGSHGGGGHFSSGGFHSSSMSSFGSHHAFAGSSIYSGHSRFNSGFNSGLNRQFGYHGWNQLNNSFGNWSSWSNPSMMYMWGLGNQGMPMYAAGPGFTDLNSSVSPTSIPDLEGNVYPAPTYRYDPEFVANYTWTEATRVSEQSAVQDEPARYRLGPDTDVISSGKVVIRVGGVAYLLVTPTATQLINTESGLPIVSLSTDPSLLWHLSAEIKRQRLGLESAIQGQPENKQPVAEQTEGSGESAALALGSLGSLSEEQKLKNLRTMAELLKTAQTNLGENTPLSPAPEPTPPPVDDADELFSGTWVTRDAKFVVLKRADGKVVYTDGNSWFSDQGKTSIPGPRIDVFKQAVVSYVSGLVSDAPKAQEYLKQFKQQSEASVHSLKDTLKKLQSEEKKADDSQQKEYTDAITRINTDLSDANLRLQNFKQMQEEMPKELATANGLLKNWQ